MPVALPLASPLTLVLPVALPLALPLATGLRLSWRSVCVRFELGEGVRLRVEVAGPCYVRAKNLKWSTNDT